MAGELFRDNIFTWRLCRVLQSNSRFQAVPLDLFKVQRMWTLSRYCQILSKPVSATMDIIGSKATMGIASGANLDSSVAQVASLFVERTNTRTEEQQNAAAALRDGYVKTG
jgi:hypothetical protein